MSRNGARVVPFRSSPRPESASEGPGARPSRARRLEALARTPPPSPPPPQGDLCPGDSTRPFDALVRTAGPGGTHLFDVDTLALPLGPRNVAVRPRETSALHAWHRGFVAGVGATSNLTTAVSVPLR